MSLLNKIRPSWLRAIVQLLLGLVVGLCSFAAVVLISMAAVTYVPPFSAWELKQQQSLLRIVIGPGVVATGVVVWMWLAYRQWRRDSAHIWLLRGVELVYQQRYEEALAATEKALAIRRTYLAAWIN
jgi:hypothetical protein